VVYDVEDMRQAANAIEDALDVIPPLQAKVSSLSQESEFLRAILAQVRADLTATTARELRLAEDLAGWKMVIDSERTVSVSDGDERSGA